MENIVLTEVGTLQETFDAVSTGNYYPAAGLALAVVAAILRFLFSKAFPKLQTDRGGLLFVLGLGLVGGALHAYFAGAALGVGLLGTWSKVVSYAIAAYVFVKKLLMPSDGKHVEIPPPEVSAPLFLAGVALGLCACVGADATSNPGRIGVIAGMFLLGAVVLAGLVLAQRAKSGLWLVLVLSLYGMSACGHDIPTDLRAGIIQAEHALLAGKTDVDTRDAAAKTAIIRKAVEVCEPKPSAEREACVNSEGERLLSLHVEARAKVTQVLTEAQSVVFASAAAIPLVERGILKDKDAIGYLKDILALALRVKDAVAAFGVSLPAILNTIPTPQPVPPAPGATP